MLDNDTCNGENKARKRVWNDWICHYKKNGQQRPQGKVKCSKNLKVLTQQELERET